MQISYIQFKVYRKYIKLLCFRFEKLQFFLIPYCDGYSFCHLYKIFYLLRHF